MRAATQYTTVFGYARGTRFSGIFQGGKIRSCIFISTLKLSGQFKIGAVYQENREIGYSDIQLATTSLALSIVTIILSLVNIQLSIQCTTGAMYSYNNKLLIYISHSFAVDSSVR